MAAAQTDTASSLIYQLERLPVDKLAPHIERLEALTRAAAAADTIPHVRRTPKFKDVALGVVHQVKLAKPRKLHFADVAHAAQHQIKHRGSEKISLALAEHLIERGVKTCSARTLAHAAEHVAESAARRTLQRQIAHAWEALTRALRPGKALIRAEANATASARAGGALTEGALQALTWMRVAVPCTGTLLIAHMAHADAHRATLEWRRAGRTISAAVLLFALAAAADVLDALLHVALAAAVGGAVHVDHDTLHSIERASLAAALCATVSMVAAELVCARAGPDGGHGHADDRCADDATGSTAVTVKQPVAVQPKMKIC